MGLLFKYSIPFSYDVIPYILLKNSSFLKSSKNNSFLSAIYKKVEDSPYKALGPERTSVLVEDISKVSTSELKKVEIFG